jgi:CRP/FNR family transcriptional regulator, anaerobic regulatory protein
LEGETTAMTELENYIQTYFGVTNDDLTKISSFFKPATLKKGDYFLKTGRHSDRLGFVQTGIMREFVLIDDKEVTKWISTKGYFVVDLSSFVFQNTARWNIQALTDCELYIIDSKDYEKIGQVIPHWATLEKLFIAKCFTVLEDRILQHLSMTAEERYHQLFHFNKELFNQVPLQYLASMLGMTPETLSRLRKKAAGQTS